MRLSHKCFLLLASVLLLTFSGAALADTVTFSTSVSSNAGSNGSLLTTNSGSGTNITTSSGVIIGVSSVNFTANFLNGQTSGVNLADVTVTNIGNGSTNIAGANVTLVINFTAPAGLNPQTLTFTGVTYGDIGGGLNNAGVLWTTATLTQATTNGTVSVSLAVEPNQIPFGHGGTPFTNSVRGLVGFTGTGQTASVPEPATLLLLGTGLAAGAAGLRKRKKKNKDE